MEQIIITRKDGSTYPLAVKREATDIKEARQSWGLLGDDVVNFTVESPYPQHYEIGDYFNVFGRTYKLNQLPRVRKGGTHKYTYELTFEGVQYDLLRVFYDVTIETTGNTLQDVQGDALTGNLHRFATVLVSNANRVFPDKWRLGECPDTIADKTLTFGDGDNCLAVYQNLCRTFEVEADITQQDGVYTINFYKRLGTTHPFVFEFGKGKGLYALDRQNVDSSNIVTRLKVFGSDDNITNKYRANRLCLPGKSKAQSFIEQAEAVQRYGIHEARKIFEDIKPTFDGTITEVVAGNVLQFKDANMFDLNAKEVDGKTTKYLVLGVSAKIHFNTGNLAGYEFDIHKYDHATRTFTLKKLTDDRGDVFPSETSSAFQFAKGDKYKILDVTLPERYQQEAEQKLQEQGNEYYRQNSQPKVKYGLSVAKSYLKKRFGADAQVTLFSPGDYINVKDESIGVDKAVRIQSLVRNLLDVYDYTLTLSDVAENNITTRVISELVEIDKITTTHRLKDPTRAKANWRSSREVLDMVFDPEGDYYSNKIKPNSIDTLALSVGAKSMQFSLQNVVFEANYKGQKNVVRVSSGTLIHYAIDERPRVWTVANALAELDDDSRAYYIFAKCSKSTNSASIIFTKEPIKTEDITGFYHFWIGVVNSVDETLRVRSIALSYGFSTINGRFVKTGRVESVDGRTYFDLDRGVIGGRIVFRGGDDAGEVDAKGYVDGLINDTNNRSVGRARIESTRALREQVSIERDRLHEIYRKLRTDKRTPKDKGLALEQAWITANGTYETLYRACNTVISTPSGANLSALESRTREYKTAMVSLQRTIQEVEQAIREDVYNEARGKTRVRVEGKTLDPNKYYPLIIKLLRKTGIDTYGIRLERPLNRDFGVPPYATHAYGYSLLLEWSVMPSGWGSNSDSRKLHAYERRFVADNELVVCPPKQETRANWEYVYVRGGSDYWVEVTGATNLDIQLYPEGVLWEASPGSKFVYRWEVLDSIASLGEPKIDLDTLKDNLLAEVAKARTSLQGAIDAAKTATKAEYEARVQEVLANVSRLESSLGDATSALQRQIDGQVDRLYGSEIARSGVPPTNLWPASDNAKHEGDTYTCVAPKGVTITASSAHEFPNVGRSWRWTNGGSGTTYGWELIADTDITQALALASKAQATADGKMTHYITPTPPVAYQQGDQWTLPAPWQGRKDGRAYTYPAGSILTATADSISGQHHPEHWVELVRYTDLKLEDVKVGARNLVLGSKAVVSYTDSPTSPGWLHRRWQLSPQRPSSKRGYCVGAWVEVTQGRPESISAILYDTASGSGRWTHNEIRASYDYAKGGRQWLTWTFPPYGSWANGEERLANLLLIYAGVAGRTQGNGISISEVCLIEGNMPPLSWTPAPEDVQAEIESKARELQRSIDAANTAIRTAQGAADAAKRQADTAKSAAEANDGKIDEAESRSIAKAVQAYQQALQVEWERLKAGYEALKASEYLADKTALTSAYSTAKQRYDTLTAKITAILADAKVGAEEYSQYVTAYKAYQPTAKTLADAIETASKAVQAELLKRADEAAKGRVDAIKVGGRNYCRIAGFPLTMHGGGNRTRPFTEVLPAGEYMVSVKIRVLNEEATHFAVRPTLDADYEGNEVYRIPITGDGVYTIPVKQTRDWDRIYLYPNGYWTPVGTGGRVEFGWVKVESGNRATDYTLAPEDVQAEIDAKAREIAQQEMSAVDYLKAVLRKGQASIQGGAILGQYIAVADLEQVVRGYISGMLNGVFLAAGVSNHGTPQETRNVEISHDGDGHFGQLHFCGSGQDGRVDLIRPGETDPYLSLGGVLRPIQEVLLDAELRDTYISNQADVDAYPLALSGLTRELKVFSVLRDGASCRVSGQLQAHSMRFNGAGDSQQSQRVTITTEILLQRQQPSSWIDVAVMGDVWVSGSSSQDYWSGESKVIDLRLPNLPKGQYRLLARSRYSDNYYQLQVISQIRIMPLTILVERVSSVQQVAFTEQGFRAFYGPRRYVDIASEGNYVLSARGATDIPGVLAAGRVNARGQVLASWGARVKDRGTDNVRVSMISDNTYIVYHSIGHLDYVVQLTVQNSWNVASYYDITPWSFRVKMSYPGGSWGNAYAGEFSYVCIGTNG